MLGLSAALTLAAAAQRLEDAGCPCLGTNDDDGRSTFTLTGETYTTAPGAQM